MVFSSLTFLFFFLPLTLILCFARKGIRWRNGVLLAASLLFYVINERLLRSSPPRVFVCPITTQETPDRRAYSAI